MRRHLPVILIGLGAFLVTAALVLRFYGSAQLAVAEKDPRDVITMNASNATVFVPSSQSEVTTDLTVKQKTVGDLEAAKDAPGGVVVWFTTTTRSTSEGVVVQQSMARTALDASTGMAKPCCESFAEVVDQAISKDQRNSLVLKFPFGTEKKTYEMWDSTSGKSVKATYRGTAEVEGMTAYRFEIKMPATVVGSQEVAAKSVGLTADGKVPADRTYGINRTLFVEPRTGAILNDVQDVNDTLTIDGQKVRTLFSGKLAYTDAQVKANVDKYGDRAATLKRFQSDIPAGSLVFGLLALGAGILLMRGSTGRSGRRAGQ
ncbi:MULTISPECIES: DUF3068 domain-containing protein [unclassified Nocardioides]|uniref:DUF3068 domain-containing protein n=1 Tax=unclassified Nocardioides TaxID=2615069 RepID=UPI0006F60DE2|nr:MULTISPECIES: DUF3068 domain-containing protein [unclassified Nocardioides]KRA38643.1 hypothetical protein ASD81_08540 [Nocardioides sp. Root614]KRA92603.1 hypothetical protein ASD84_08805 [Nocardioides sp. Root682]